MATVKREVDVLECDRCKRRGTVRGIKPYPNLRALWDAMRGLLNRPPVTADPEFCGACQATLSNMAWSGLNAKKKERRAQ